jgi:hypothetical protein
MEEYAKQNLGFQQKKFEETELELRQRIQGLVSEQEHQLKQIEAEKSTLIRNLESNVEKLEAQLKQALKDKEDLLKSTQDEINNTQNQLIIVLKKKTEVDETIAKLQKQIEEEGNFLNVVLIHVIMMSS